jgi:hypothetical protein
MVAPYQAGALQIPDVGPDRIGPAERTPEQIAAANAPEPTWSIQDLEAKLRKAHEAGDAENAKRFADAIREGNYMEGQNDAVSAGMGFSQGATLGFGDEVAAGIRAMIEPTVDPYMFGTLQSMANKFNPEGQPEGWRDKSFSELVDEREQMFWEGKDFKTRYNDALSTSRGMMETARREDPYMTGAGEMLGAGALTAAPATALVKGSGLVKGLGKLAGFGVAEGGTAGYGYSEADPLATALDEDATSEEAIAETQRAAIDAGITASIGGGLSLLMPLGASAARAVTRFFAKPFTAGVKAKEAARKEIAANIAEDLETGNMTMQQAQREIDATPGMTAADLGPAMQDMAEKVANTPYEGSRLLRTWLEGRNKEQWARMNPRIAEAVSGSRTDTFAKAERNLIADMKEKADTGYAAAYGIPVRVNTPMKATMEQPAFKSALDTANVLRSLDGKDALPEIKAGQMMSTKEIDQVIQGMDDVITQAFKDQPAVARALKPIRDEFREHVYQQNPALRAARKEWSGDKANEEAMSSGLKIFREDADMLEEQIRDMTTSELQHYKLGALRAITRKLGNKSDVADVTKGLFDRPNQRAVLELAFGGKKKFQKFMDYVEQEQKMFQTYKQANAGSPSARRLAQQGVSAGGKFAALLGYGVGMSTGTGMPPSISGYLARKGYESVAPAGMQNAAGRNLSQNQADMLMSGNLEALMKPNTVGGLLDTGIPTTGAVGTTGLIGSGLPQAGTEYGEF